ncbi:putative aminoacyltransferase, E1 ubiquitin-activating enzyme [Rosa chinensis]|uniref:RING-type E3 ubiquitin transferase n=1 Tax=Rosa chinensis TaxID=74649 RepID=A0A2P6S4K0_ROSCH|nr:E3 ubiquitin-protein ligase MPSR1 [Rosa chinensis]PRQ53598.1 putative aminoacyltransferase, E1 ubiquitin-activating enzyme [Rosa chinensis]
MSDFSNPRTSDQMIGETPVLALPTPAIDVSASRQQLLALIDFVFADQPTVVVGASKASIEDMPRVIVTDEGMECSICLESFKVCGEAKEMPCKHRFHAHCIENWLYRRASCPLCRFTVPVDLEEETNGMSEHWIDITDFLDFRDMD